jgi:hypothetical protein
VGVVGGLCPSLSVVRDVSFSGNCMRQSAVACSVRCGLFACVHAVNKCLYRDATWVVVQDKSGGRPGRKQAGH